MIYFTICWLSTLLVFFLLYRNRANVTRQDTFDRKRLREEMDAFRKQLREGHVLRAEDLQGIEQRLGVCERTLRNLGASAMRGVL